MQLTSDLIDDILVQYKICKQKQRLEFPLFIATRYFT